MKFDFTLEYVDVTVDGKALKFYPLNFKALRTMAGELKQLQNDAAPDAQFVSIIKVLTASANRKGQTVTEEELQELLSVSWANKIIAAVNDLSGVKAKEGEKDPKADQSKSPTGDVSTLTSLQ